MSRERFYRTVDSALRDEDPLHGRVEPWGTTSLETQPVQDLRRERTLATVTGLLCCVAAGFVLLAAVGVWRGWL